MLLYKSYALLILTQTIAPKVGAKHLKQQLFEVVHNDYSLLVPDCFVTPWS